MLVLIGGQQKGRCDDLVSQRPFNIPVYSFALAKKILVRHSRSTNLDLN
jgi:hypothetical protein